MQENYSTSSKQSQSTFGVHFSTPKHALFLEHSHSTTKAPVFNSLTCLLAISDINLYLNVFLLWLCTHASVRCYQFSDGRFAPSSDVSHDFCQHLSDSTIEVNANFYQNVSFWLPDPKNGSRKSVARWCKLQSDACEHTYRNRWNPKNCIHKSDVVRMCVV